MAGGVLDELIVVVKTLFDDKGAKKSEKFNKDWKNVVMQIAREYVKLVQKIEQSLNAMARFNQAFIDFTRQTSIAMETLNKYVAVGQSTSYNFNASTAIQSIEQLQQKLVELQITGSGARPFQLLGINPIGKDATQIIEEVRNKIVDLNNEQATYLLNQLGISPEMLPILRMTKKEFAEMSDLWGRFQFNEEQRKQILEYGIQLKKINMQFKFLQEGLALKFTPLLLKGKEALVFMLKLGTNLYNIFVKLGGLKLFEPLMNALKLIGLALSEIEDLLMWITGTGKTVLGERYGEFADVTRLNQVKDWYQDESWLKKLLGGLIPIVGFNNFAEGLQRMNGNVTQTNNIYVNNDETGQKIGSRVKDMSFTALRYQYATVR